MGTFLSDIVLQVLSFVAENERTNIRQRQAEGIAAARAKGIRFGRAPKPLPSNFHAVYQRWKNSEITGTTAAKECGMPLSTFRYRADIYENAKELLTDKEAYEKQYQVFCKLLKASRKEVPLSEIIDCIERIVVDVDRKIMVKWTE